MCNWENRGSLPRALRAGMTPPKKVHSKPPGLLLAFPNFLMGILVTKTYLTYTPLPCVGGSEKQTRSICPLVMLRVPISWWRNAHLVVVKLSCVCVWSRSKSKGKNNILRWTFLRSEEVLLPIPSSSSFWPIWRNRTGTQAHMDGLPQVFFKTNATLIESRGKTEVASPSSFSLYCAWALAGNGGGRRGKN